MSGPPHFLGSMTLKALLEDPNLKNPPHIVQSTDYVKVKTEGEKDSTNIPKLNYGSAAFLGGNLWDNQSYDGIDFSFEYMDLDAFLSENALEEETKEVPVTSAQSSNTVPPAPVSQVSPRQFLRTPPVNPPKQQSSQQKQYLTPSPPSPSQFSPAPGPSSVVSSGGSVSDIVSVGSVSDRVSVVGAGSPLQTSRSSSPSSPFSVEFQVSEQDLALTSIPDYADGYRPKWNTYGDGDHYGHEEFDPRRKQFSEEELKPQPIIKKSKKVFVPEDLKDDKYWARRHKNNFAAKRSRDARRVKENQIAMRASFLEKENGCLRDELARMKKENNRLKAKVEKYEGPSTSPSQPAYEPSVIDHAAQAALDKLYASMLGSSGSDMDGPSSPIGITSLAFS